MARIRSLKPEFWDDRKLAKSTSRDARMLYMGMWNQADEHGRLNGDVLWLKGRVFPYDEDVTTAEVCSLLKELEAAGRIDMYEVDGDPFIFLPKLSKHQRLEPNKVESKIPEPAQIRSNESARGANESAYQRERARIESDDPNAEKSAQDAESSTLLYGTGSMEHVSGVGVVARTSVRAAPAPSDNGRGTRLPDDWRPDAGLVEWARAEGYPDSHTKTETAKFIDHWHAQPGTKGRKADWAGTWRNWLRRSVSPSMSKTREQQSTDALFERAAERNAIRAAGGTA